MAVKRRVIRRTATRSRRSFSCAALKEASARFAPALLCACIFRRDRPQQSAGAPAGVDLDGHRGDAEVAKLNAEERRGGKECVSTWSCMWSPDQSKKTEQ